MLLHPRRPIVELKNLLDSRKLKLKKTIMFLTFHHFTIKIFPLFLGDSVVLWKQGERVISAGPIQVRKDPRFALVEAASLRISDVVVADTGNPCNDTKFEIGCLISVSFYRQLYLWSRVERTAQTHHSPTCCTCIPNNMGCISWGPWTGNSLCLCGSVLEVTCRVPPNDKYCNFQLLFFQNRPVEAREGSSVQLECQADGIPPPIIRWRRQVRGKIVVFYFNCNLLSRFIIFSHFEK